MAENSRFQTYLAGGLAIAVAVAILTLSIPRTIGAFIGLPADPIQGKLHRGEEVSSEELHKLIENRTSVLEWIQNRSIYTDIGVAQRLLAKEAGYDSDEGLEYLRLAEDNIVSGLVLGPADAITWNLLGFIRSIRNGPSEGAAKALRTSILLGRYDRRLWRDRLKYCFYNWRYFDEEGRDVVLGQVRLVWQHKAHQVLEAAKEQKSIWIVRLALADQPEDLKKLSEKLKKKS